jgi:hypothetical protein
MAYSSKISAGVGSAQRLSNTSDHSGKSQ